MLPRELLDVVSSHVKRQPMSAADLFVNKLPGLPADSRLRLYAGHLPAYAGAASTDADPHLFFLLAKAFHPTNRFVIWLNGGPGCSSLAGWLMEVGSVRVVLGNGSTHLEPHLHPWNEYADVLYIDQPAGTGFSYLSHGAPVTELSEAAAQIVAFLVQFYKIFPEYATASTYLAGESYAGQFIPYTADAMLKSALINAPLKGLLLGNPWIDPARQYAAYLPFAYESGLLRKGSKEAARANDVDRKCNATLEAGAKDHVLVPECEELLGVIFPDHASVDGVPQCTSPYNIEFVGDCNAAYPPSTKRTTQYLNRPDVVEALHASSKHTPWAQCNSTVTSYVSCNPDRVLLNGWVRSQMWSFNSKPASHLLPGLLDKLEVLLFAGELDAMCNWLGVYDSIQAMEWRGQTGLGNATVHDWSVNGTRVGTWTTARNLHWVRYEKASHMVVLEEPLGMSDMLIRFTGIDVLEAAGSTARIPSKLSGQQEAILGVTHPNGTTLQKPKEATGPVLLDDADTQEESREAFYGPRRTTTLVLAMAAAVAVVVLFVRYVSRRRRFHARGVQLKQSGRGKRTRFEQDPLELEHFIKEQGRV